MNIFFITLYLFINIVPFSILRYYLFWDKLRISKRLFLTIFTIIFGIEVIGFNYILHNHFELSNNFRLSFSIIFFIYSCIAIKERLSKHALVFIFLTTFLSTLTGISHLIEFYFYNYNTFLINIIVVSILYLIVFPFAIWFLNTYIKLLFDCDNFSADLNCLLTMTIFAIIFFSTSSLANPNDFNFNMLILRIIASIGIIISCIILARLHKFYKDLELEKSKKISRDKLLEFANNQYTQICKKLETTKKNRHDWKHHLTSLSSYLKNEDYIGLKKYLEHFIDLQPKDIPLVFSKNYALNSIISHYFEICESKNIDFNINLNTVTEPLRISEPELCVVLGNLLDNAVLACSKEKAEKKINLTIRYEGSHTLIITVDNTFTGSLYLKEGKLLSTKHKGFGIGTSSVTAIAENFNGIARFETTCNEFRASVRLENTI